MQVIVAMLVAHAAPNAVPAAQLAPAIIYAAERHSVDPVLLTQILLVESRGNAGAFNSATQDHGIMQINERTRVAYGISKWCAAQWRCNINSATRILADMWRMQGARPCVYNLGPRGRFSRYEAACLKYEKKLDMMIAEVL